MFVVSSLSISHIFSLRHLVFYENLECDCSYAVCTLSGGLSLSLSFPPSLLLLFCSICFNGFFHCLESCLMNNDYIIHTTITCTPHLDGSLSMYILPVILQFFCTMQGGNQIEFKVTCSYEHFGNVSRMMFLVCIIIACYLLFALLSLFCLYVCKVFEVV